MRFSQRIGLTPASKIIQRESIDDELRNTLWSLLTFHYWSHFTSGYRHESRVRGSNLEPFIIRVWFYLFKEPTDSIPAYWDTCLAHLRNYFFSANWIGIYEFVEFAAQNGVEDKNEHFISDCNLALERENSAYRFVDGYLAEITSREEIQSIEDAITNAEPYAGVKTHLTTALTMMSSKTHPDYRNSIKESISAVESLAKKVSNNDSGTLGAILKALEQSKKLHPALAKAFSSLYGYTNDADGIRHGLLDEQNLTKADARFMLVCCSAFVNYTIEAVGT